MLVADRFRTAVDADGGAGGADDLGDARIQRSDDSRSFGVERSGPERRKSRVRLPLHDCRDRDQPPTVRAVSRARTVVPVAVRLTSGTRRPGTIRFHIVAIT